MKGYGIYVKNELLEAKHYQSMGKSIWLYLWLLDRMTSVSETGEGRVLGGKPIKLEEIDLGISARSYGRYIQTLTAAGYIKIVRTPYGHIFTVYKAVKIFGNTKIRQFGVCTKIRQIGGNKEDNTVDNTNTKENIKKMSFNKYGDDHLEEEVQIDPDHKPPEKKVKAKSDVQAVFDLFSSKARGMWPTQKQQVVAAQILFDEYGLETLTKRVKRIELEMKAGDQYCPQITSPKEMLEKMEKFEKFIGK